MLAQSCPSVSSGCGRKIPPGNKKVLKKSLGKKSIKRLQPAPLVCRAGAAGPEESPTHKGCTVTPPGPAPGAVGTGSWAQMWPNDVWAARGQGQGAAQAGSDLPGPSAPSGAMAPFVPSSAPTMLHGLPDPALCALRAGQPCLPRDSWWGGAALGVAPCWLGTTRRFAAPPYPVLLPSTRPRSLSLARAPQERCRNWPPTWPEFIPFMPGAQALLTPRWCLPRGLYGEFPPGQRGFPCPPKHEH